MSQLTKADHIFCPGKALPMDVCEVAGCKFLRHEHPSMKELGTQPEVSKPEAPPLPPPPPTCPKCGREMDAELAAKMDGLCVRCGSQIKEPPKA